MSVVNSGFGGNNGYAQITIHADADYSKCITLENLNDARNIYAKTKDVYGNVWFIGGRSFSTSVDKYLIDGTHATYSLSRARELYKKCATYDSNGNVYVFGGGSASSGSDVDVVDKFSPDGTRTTSYIDDVGGDVHALTDKNGNIWCSSGDTVVKISPSGAQTKLSMSESRLSDMASAMDGAGNIYFAGGRSFGSRYLSTVDKFSTDGTRTTLQLQQARSDLSSATDGLGNVWFAGGVYGNSSGETSDAVDKFTPSGTRTTYTLSTGESDMASATDKEGSVYFGSGTTVLNKFTISGTRTILTTQSGVTELVTDGKGYVINANSSSGYVERFDLNGNSTKINGLSKRNGAAACVDGKGCVLLAGGTVNSNNTNKVEKIVRDTVLIPVPPGTIYKYPDQEENIAEEDEILSFAEGDGYIKYKKTEWEIN